ncbi:hypothetical protein RDV64_23620 (plasmid) [Acuticoccus sp. MNP-M23]|uniref:hypothetical protein n=1 Tax=Acuticoccus sp. MNP-M23 TaxID=3072793 RepID=UPI002814E5A1|nr:hypothetical protein [Acuticoccus sp. MNP-M23]WMS45325.1 hypothetical protein RDV64_23620 [Acuticoccus sp. MNP-M23]
MREKSNCASSQIETLIVAAIQCAKRHERWEIAVMLQHVKNTLKDESEPEYRGAKRLH